MLDTDTLSFLTRQEPAVVMKAQEYVAAYGRLTDGIAVRAAAIYADLYRRGLLIGDADILIAATALEHGLTLITNNENHFRRVPCLVMTNWRIL